MENVNEKTRTTENVTISRAEYEALSEENTALKKANEELNSTVHWYEEQMKALQKRLFGKKSEAASEEVAEQMNLFNEAETYAYLLETEEPEEKTSVAAHTRSKKKQFLVDHLPENIETRVVEHGLPEDQLACPNCGEQMEQIGKKVEKSLVIEPARVYVREDHYFTYACKKCEEEACETKILETPHEQRVYPGSPASAEAVAYLMTEKYVMGSPLYRMEAEFERRNILLSRQTMSNWIIYAAETYLRPIYEALHKELLKEDILHADETTLQVLREPGKKAESTSYMWLYRTGKHAANRIVLYEYQPGRSQDYPKAFLKGFSGYLQTDGYAGYNSVENCVHVGCMAHLKRKFHEAVEALPKGKRTGAAVEGEAYCSKLFALEERFEELTPEERYAKRQEISKKLLDEFLAWGSSRKAAPKSKLGIALSYLQNQGGSLSNYLLDGRLEISNNIAERSIKMFVIDRKNFLFSNTPKGAETSAITFSIIQTALANNLDPYRYLTFVLDEGAKADRTAKGWENALLPKKAPDSCRV